MESSIFGITENDIQNKLFPDPDDHQFDIEDIDSDLLETIVETCEQRLLGMLPRRYRKLINRCEEILTEYADPSVTQCLLSLPPITTSLYDDSCKIYIDYYNNKKRWENRNYGDTASFQNIDYDINNQTGLLTISLLSGQKLYAEYEHTYFKENPNIFKEHTITLSAVEVARRYMFFKEDTGSDRYNIWELAVISDCKRWRDDIQGYPTLDKINIIGIDTTDNPYYEYLKKL